MERVESDGIYDTRRIQLEGMEYAKEELGKLTNEEMAIVKTIGYSANHVTHKNATVAITVVQKYEHHQNRIISGIANAVLGSAYAVIGLPCVASEHYEIALKKLENTSLYYNIACALIGLSTTYMASLTGKEEQTRNVLDRLRDLIDNNLYVACFYEWAYWNNYGAYYILTNNRRKAVDCFVNAYRCSKRYCYIAKNMIDKNSAHMQAKVMKIGMEFMSDSEIHSLLSEEDKKAKEDAEIMIHKLRLQRENITKEKREQAAKIENA